jgi:hypothetical protein
MEQSPTEAKSLSTCQEIPCLILGRAPAIGLILSQINSVHSLIAYFFTNLILHAYPYLSLHLPKRPFPFGFFH